MLNVRVFGLDFLPHFVRTYQTNNQSVARVDKPAVGSCGSVVYTTDDGDTLSIDFARYQIALVTKIHT